MRIYFGGGLNEQQSPHINEAANGSYNFELNKDRYNLGPRAPFDLKGTTTNAGDVRGIMQLVKRDGTETTIVQSGATVYKWDGSSTFSSVGTATSATSQLRDFYYSLADLQVITDLQKLTPVSTWNGTTFGTMSTGLATSLYAKYGITHLGRVWLFNVTTSSDTPHLMVASAFENYQSYDTTKRAKDSSFTGTEAFYMLTPDLRPINGVCLWQKDLVISTKEGQLYRLTGTNSTDFAWTPMFLASNAVGDESLVNIGNDIAYMRKGGSIDSLSNTQQNLDVTTDDMSRWIATTTKNLTSCISVYDQHNQKVLFFISGKVLVLFKDIYYGGALMDESGQRAKLSPWSVYKTAHANGFVVSSAKYMRIPGTTNHSVYFGDSSGRLFDLNGSGGSGDGGTSTVSLVRKTRTIDEKDQIDFISGITEGSVQYRRIGQCSFSISFDWADEYNTSTVSVTLKGPVAGSGAAYFGGAYYFGGTIYFGGSDYADKISHQIFSAVGKASSCRLTFSADNNILYQVDNVELM
jgi:hypothetical protein